MTTIAQTRITIVGRRALAGTTLAGALLLGATLMAPGAAAQSDADADGLFDADEIGVYLTNPQVFDTDGDGLGDGEEVYYGTNPLVADAAAPVRADSDADGLYDDDEMRIYGTNPNVADSDGDGVSDGEEVYAGTDPLAGAAAPADPAAPGSAPADTAPADTSDIDGDGLTGAQETQYGTVHNDADTDKDLLSDGDEVLLYGTNPLAWDTDGNGYRDSEDVARAMGGAAPADPGQPEPYEPYEPMEPAVTEEEREVILSGGGGGGGAGGGGTAGGGDACDIEGACGDARYQEPFPENRFEPEDD